MERGALGDSIAAREALITMTAAVAFAVVALVSAGGAGAVSGPAGAAKAPTRIIDGTAIVGDCDAALWRLVLDVLPARPPRIEVLDLDSLSDQVRAKLRGLDAFVLAGQTTVVVIRQGATLRQAALGDDVDRLILASLVWHEMAHTNGFDEPAAFAAEEALWRQFIASGRVRSDVGMAYVSRLRETVSRGSEARAAGLPTPFVPPTRTTAGTARRGTRAR